MRFLQPDLRQNDRAVIRRWTAPVASVIHFFLFTHYQSFSAQLSGISTIVVPARRYFDGDDPFLSVIQRHLVWQGVAP
jgi:hypothetical protein